MKRLIWFFPVISGILFGAIGLFAKPLGKAGLDNFTVVESRMLVSAVMLFLLILITDRSLFKIHPKDLAVIVVASICGMMLMNLTYNYAVNQMTMSLAAVLISLSPIYTLFLSALFFKEKLTVRKILISCAAIAGCVFASGLLENGLGTVTFPGLFCGIMSGVFYTFYTLFIKLISEKKYAGLTITFYSILTISVVLFWVCDWNSIGQFILDNPVNHTLFLLAHSLFATALPYVMYNYAVGKMDSGIVSILASAEPVAAMVFGILIYHDTATVYSILGIFFMLGALTALTLDSRQKQ